MKRGAAIAVAVAALFAAGEAAACVARPSRAMQIEALQTARLQADAIVLARVTRLDDVERTVVFAPITSIEGEHISHTFSLTQRGPDLCYPELTPWELGDTAVVYVRRGADTPYSYGPARRPSESYDPEIGNLLRKAAERIRRTGR